MKTRSVKSGQYADASALMKALDALPTAPYIPLKPGEFDPAHAYDIDQNSAGITNAGSAHPSLVTSGVATCMAVAVFNPRTRTGGLAHLSQDVDDPDHLSPASAKALQALLDAMRRTPAEGLEVRISGPMEAGGMEDSFILDVLSLLNRAPNLTFQSADMRGKVHPKNVGIDTRRWEEGLIKGSSTARFSVEEIRKGGAALGQRAKEGLRDVVDLGGVPYPPGYDEQGLFDARSPAKFADRKRTPPAPAR